MTRINKAWPAVVVVLLGLGAYAHARGADYLVGEELTATPQEVAPEPLPPQLHQAPAERDDSLAGPTVTARTTAANTTPVDAPVEPTITTPDLSAPFCDFGQVTVIATSVPDYAYASIATRTETSSSYKIGDAVGDSTLLAIEWDRVWLDGPDGECQMRLGDKIPAAKKRRNGPPERPRGPDGKLLPNPLPDHIRDRITWAGEGRYKIERAAFMTAFDLKNGLTRGTLIDKVKENGKTIGIRLTGRGTKEGGLLHAVGMRHGDVLKSINGQRMSSVQKALQVYGVMGSLDEVKIVVERGGEDQTIEYQIQ